MAAESQRDRAGVEDGGEVAEHAVVGGRHELAIGAAPARLSSEEITVFDAVGFALEDYSALRFLHTLQSARQIDLVPDLDDPKDLYGGTLARSRLRKTA